MDIRKLTPDVSNLTWLLLCFQRPSQVNDLKRETTVDLEGYEFNLPLQWLATMIVRSSADITILLENILTMKYLGELDEEALTIYHENCLSKSFKCDPTAMACEPNQPNQFGFRLPHGIRTESSQEMAEDLIACLTVFNRIEECYQEWFGLAPGGLLTEKQHSFYLDVNPHMYPRY